MAYAKSLEERLVELGFHLEKGPQPWILDINSPISTVYRKDRKRLFRTSETSVKITTYPATLFPPDG